MPTDPTEALLLRRLTGLEATWPYVEGMRYIPFPQSFASFASYLHPPTYVLLLLLC